MSDEDFNFEQDLEIDFYNLHNDWKRQPGLMSKYKKMVARYQKKFRKAEEKKKTIRSEIIKEIRETNPKATGVAIEAEYRTDKRYIEAVDDLIEAEYEFNMAESAVSAIHQKKPSLENEVKLLGMDYFSIPKEDVKSPDSMISAIQDEKNTRSRRIRGRQRK